MRKQLELILTACLPVVILIVGFFAVSSRADLTTTVSPDAATDYYGFPGMNQVHFGTEITSSDLCGTTNGLEIYDTVENASVSNSDILNEIAWDRSQSWGFANTPWGVNYAITSTNGLLNVEFDVTDGFPWSGFETHTRYLEDDGSLSVLVIADVTRWMPHEEDEEHYICPYSYRSSTEVRYICDSNPPLHVWDTFKLITNIWVRDHIRVDYFLDPEFRDEEQTILARKSFEWGEWHNCMKVNPDEDE